MIDPAMMFMGICYLIMCLQYGWHKIREEKYLYGVTNLIELFFVGALYSYTAPITATVDLFRRVK